MKTPHKGFEKRLEKEHSEPKNDNVFEDEERPTCLKSLPRDELPANDDHKTWEVLYEELRPQLTKAIATTVGPKGIDPSVLEDLIQATWHNVLSHIGDFRRDSKLSTWIYRIAVNVTKNYIRTDRRKGKQFADIPLTTLFRALSRAEEDDDEDVGQGLRDQLSSLIVTRTSEDDAMAEEFKDCVYHALETNEGDHITFKILLDKLMDDWQYLSNEELAKIRNKSRNAIKQDIHRTRKMLQSDPLVRGYCDYFEKQRSQGIKFGFELNREVSVERSWPLDPSTVPNKRQKK